MVLFDRCAFIYDWLYTWLIHTWKQLSTATLQSKFFDKLGFRFTWWNFWRSDRKSSGEGPSSMGGGGGVSFKDGFPPGLDNNISLPATGEEAMRRLLACKGKDPYR